LQHGPHVPPRGGRRPEGILLGLGIEKAAHRVESSEVNRENVQSESPWYWGETGDACPT
jgi:hypothetical protein